MATPSVERIHRIPSAWLASRRMATSSVNPPIAAVVPITAINATQNGRPEPTHNTTPSMAPTMTSSPWAKLNTPVAAKMTFSPRPTMA